jgi:hypothetical protein
MPAELPRDLQNPVVVSPVVRLVFSPTPAVQSKKKIISPFLIFIIKT